MSERRPTVAVVGGGIAGLATAWRLRDDADVTLFEASGRVGGKLWADEFLGHAVDRGADSFLARVPDAVELCRELGLDRSITAPVARKAWLLHEGRLRPFPDGLVLGVPTDLDALAASGLVSPEGVERARRDLHDPAPALTEDTTVGRYVRGRVGDEVFETLVMPLLSGINAGDADELSLDAGTPQLAAAARAGGSLIARLRELQARSTTDPDAPVFHSLLGGAGQLADELAARLDPCIERGTPVDALARTSAGYEVEGAGARRAFDAVVLATPAPVTGRLLRPHLPEVADELEALEYASVAVVTFGFDEVQLVGDLAGSGFLVPEREGLLMTACSWGSSKWPHWADPGTAVLRVSAGRAHDRRSEALDDDELIATLHAELGRTMGVTGPPLRAQVTRWPGGLPQYRPGHLDRVDRWEAALAEHLPGVALAGASLRGLGVPACIGSARDAADRVRAALG